MDTQEGHSTALLGAETMDRRGVWVRKPMFEADWEDTSAWAVYRGKGFTAENALFERRLPFDVCCVLRLLFVVWILTWRLQYWPSMHRS